MTTGQILFLSGIGLLLLTLILAVIFIIKRPKYVPDSTVYGSAAADKTQRLRNGYPTDSITIRRESAQSTGADTDKQDQETELLTEKLTELLPDTEQLQKAKLLEQQRAETLTEKSPHGGE